MPAEQASHVLRPFVASLVVGDPINHLNLTVIPLRGNGQAPIDYVLGSDAIEAGTLTVTEIDEGGSVPELLVISTTDQMVLLLDGEELIGAKQNRILNTSILLPPRANKVKIPVSCVEQGRWRHVSPAFAMGSYSPSRLRARKSRHVSRSLMEHGVAASDQGRSGRRSRTLWPRQGPLPRPWRWPTLWSSDVSPSTATPKRCSILRVLVASSSPSTASSLHWTSSRSLTSSSGSGSGW